MSERVEAAAKALHEKSWELWKPERKGPPYDDDAEHNKEYFRVRARIALEAADAMRSPVSVEQIVDILMEEISEYYGGIQGIGRAAERLAAMFAGKTHGGVDH